MRLSIEVDKKRFKEISKGDEFVEAPIEFVEVHNGAGAIMRLPVVGVSVNRRKGTILVQVGKGAQ